MNSLLNVDLATQWVAPLADALRARGWRLATAESCTGGLIAATCTALAGSSDWFERGFVTYSNAAKTELLGVPEALLLAQALAAAGDQEAALAAFDEALARHNSTESRCAYGLYLASLGRDTRARELLESVMRDAKLVDEHARVLNRESLDQARAALRELDSRNT